MNILQKFGLQKEDEAPVTPAVTDTQKQIAQPLFQTFGTQTSFTAPVLAPVSSKTDYNKHLDDVLEKNNQPGFDFYEFNKTLRGLDNKPLAEQQKYETAYIAAESMGLKPNDLITSGRQYLSVLTQEETDFNAEVQNATKVKVTDKETEMQKLVAKNAELTKQIEDNNQRCQQLSAEVIESKNSLGTEKQAFDYALNNKRNIINDTLSKIQQYLNGTTN